MATVYAWEKLFNDVVARFASDGTAVPNEFGWRTPSKRGAEQNRICWVPGDPSDAAGDVGPAQQPGRNPRPLGTLNELFTIYIEARDSSEPENELKQYRAARSIFDAWYRAVYLKPLDGEPRQKLTVKAPSWVRGRKVRVNGATMRVVCSLPAMIPDTAYTEAEDVEAVVEMQLDSDDNPATYTSESFDVPPLEEP
jgi:hypothetical protein